MKRETGDERRETLAKATHANFTSPVSRLPSPNPA